MRPPIIFCFTFLLVVLLPGCHRCKDASNPECSNYNPCNQATRFQPYFLMKEICTNQSGGLYWIDYETSITRGGYIQFTSTDSIDSCEWHIGAGVYYGHQFYLNFNNAPNGSIIPVMLIVKHKQDTMCFPNNNGLDTVTRNLRIDSKTELEWGSWQGYFSDNPTVSAIVNIQKFYQPVAQDTFYYISNLISGYDSVNTSGVGRFYEVARQELAFEIDGNGTFILNGDVLTDSAGQNITINYSYLDTPGYTQLIHKIFTGKRI